MCCRLLGEPCDSRLLLEHYGKPSAQHRDQEIDFKSESAAIYVLVNITRPEGPRVTKDWFFKVLTFNHGEHLDVLKYDVIVV